jgi:hypothetical protein
VYPVAQGWPAASFLIAAGVMSGVPVIFSCFRLDDTVELPLTASTIAAIPNTISTAPAMNPPISRTFFMVIPPWKLE